MIISKISGGLGNQMFQYAASLALANKIKTQLLLDITGYKGYKLHNGFEIFSVFDKPYSVDFADQKIICKVLGLQSNPTIGKVIKKYNLDFIRNKKWIIEPSLGYWSGFEFLCENQLYLDGYWQSEKYFKNQETLIRESLKFNGNLGEDNEVLLKHAGERTLVSLHVRRGDYTSATNQSIHGVCSLDYYRKAISYITEKIQNPFFIIFSDDIDWVRSNLSIPFHHEYAVFNKGANSYKDMWMMSLCDHNIIANSSFSWWGAWLNNNPNKIVISPKTWFASVKLQEQAWSLYCDNWIKL